MNRKQKKCLWIGIALIVVMGLFPPWVIERREKLGVGIGEWGIIDRFQYKDTAYAGPYSWIGHPPVGNQTAKASETAKFVDLYRLGIQYFVVAVVTAGLIITLRDKKDPKQ